jgi:hypothetical protein
MTDHDAVRGAEADLASNIGQLLDRLPRTRITPDTITQSIIDHWYRREENYRADLRKLHEAGVEITKQCNALLDENKQLRQQINALISRPYVPEVGAL